MSSAFKLYEIPREIDDLCARAVDEEGAIDTDAEAELDALTMALEDKALACASQLKSEIAQADALKAEAQKLLDRAKGHRTTAEWLRGYIGRNGERHLGHVSLSDSRSVISWGRSTSVEVLDIGKLPVECVRLRPPEADKIQIKAQLKLDPDSLAGAAKLVTVERVRIK